MPASNEYRHDIRVHSRQMEMASPGAAGAEDYEQRLRATHEEMERIRQQREELERRKQELEELTARKRAFLAQQTELTEKLSTALTQIDRELYEMRSEAEDLQQCRATFASHLDKIQKINPEAWSGETLGSHLERAGVSLDLAADEYDQAATHFEGTRAGSVFGVAGSKGGRRVRSSGAFLSGVRDGFAFNLPVLLLGIAALAVWIVKG
jgi:chromosome segregation ATPase